MAVKVCSIPNCDRKAKGRGWCGTHWLRWRKHGDPTIVKSAPPQHVGCKVDSCANKHHAYGYCSKHASRLKRHGDPLIEANHYPGRPRMHAPSYAGLHKRLSRERGKASKYQCVDCDKRAQEWSYNGGCPNELSEVLINVPVPYSTDQTRYSPRCISCHRRRDESVVRSRDEAGRFATTL